MRLAFLVSGRPHCGHAMTRGASTVFSVPCRLRATLATVVAFALAPAVAQADQYVVDHCKNWDSGAGGVAFPAFTGATTNDCGNGGGLHLQVPGARMAAGTSVGMTLSISADRPNITIDRVHTQYGAPAATTVTPSGGTPFLTLFNHLGQQVRNDVPPATPVVDTLLPPGARSLTWSVYCSNDAPCTFSSEYLVHVYKTRLFLNEAVAPTLTVTGGTLAGAGAKAGEQSVAFDADDADSGVASVAVTLGSTVVGSVQYACAFKDWSACQRDRRSQLLRVDTTKVPDGAHELFVTARDAANNAFTRGLGTVSVANGGVSAPNGAGASRLAKISAGFVTTKRRAVRLRDRSQPTIRGRLVDERDQPIAGATVAVLQRLDRAGADPVQVGTVQTAGDGAFSYKLNGGPSRTVTFAYSAFTNDPEPTTTSSLRTIVRARVAARISPRSLRAPGRISLVGKLSPLGGEGIEVKIQARNGRRWQRSVTRRRRAAAGSAGAIASRRRPGDVRTRSARAWRARSIRSPPALLVRSSSASRRKRGGPPTMVSRATASGRAPARPAIAR